MILLIFVCFSSKWCRYSRWCANSTPTRSPWRISESKPYLEDLVIFYSSSLLYYAPTFCSFPVLFSEKRWEWKTIKNTDYLKRKKHADLSDPNRFNRDHLLDGAGNVQFSVDGSCRTGILCTVLWVVRRHFQKKTYNFLSMHYFLKYPWQYKRRIFSQSLYKIEKKKILSQFLEDKALLCD